MKSRFSSALLIGAGVAGAGYYVSSSNFSYKPYMSDAKEKLRTRLRQMEEEYPAKIHSVLTIGSVISINQAMKYGYLSKVPFRLKILPSVLLSILCADELTYDYYRFLSAPVNAILDVPFSQSPYLISRIIWRSANYDMLDGVCYGVTCAWGEHEVAGKNLMAELKKPVFSLDHSLLEKIDMLQEEGTFAIPEKTTCWPLPSASHPNIDSVTKKVVNKAVNNPGKLYNLLFYGRSGNGHVIGVMAQTVEGKSIVKYFDSNLREATLQDKAAAQKSLALTLRYGGYACMFQDKPRCRYNVKKLPRKRLNDNVSFACIMERKIS